MQRLLPTRSTGSATRLLCPGEMYQCLSRTTFRVSEESQVRALWPNRDSESWKGGDQGHRNIGKVWMLKSPWMKSKESGFLCSKSKSETFLCQGEGTLLTS